MGGMDAKHIPLAGPAQVPFDVADAIDSVARNPAERHSGGNGALDHRGASCGLVAKATSLGTDVAFRRAGSSVQPFGK